MAFALNPVTPFLRDTTARRLRGTIHRRHAASQEIDLEKSGLKHLSEAAKERALARKANKFEKIKVQKCGSRMWTEIYELSQLIREGKTSWEDLDLDDIDVRMKWAGLFHRRKRVPGTFMMRIKVYSTIAAHLSSPYSDDVQVPNGELTAKELRCLGDCIAPFGDSGCADITTRSGIQLRGVTLETAAEIIDKLASVGMTSFQSGMDNVRNLTGNPIAGVDPHELTDTRPICRALQKMITNDNQGNPEMANLPRKINFCVSSTRDDFVHTHINDVAFEAVTDPSSGELRFNVLMGGYFSIKRNATSIPIDTSITEDQIVPFSKALLEVFRDHGPRENRQRTRIMWMLEEMGVEKLRELVSEKMGGVELGRGVEIHYDEEWERRDLLGVHDQKQTGLKWIGAHVPVGRLYAADFYDAADIAEKYGDGTLRVTCDMHVLFVNIPTDQVDACLQESFFQRYRIDPGPLERNLVSCTGSQFCGLALYETKNRAMRVIEQLESELDIPKGVRIHFTGCPNSCGQAQVGEIGLMGAPAKLDGKAVEGVKIFVGGKIGENPKLAEELETGIPAQEDILKPKLKEILISEFNAKPKATPTPLPKRADAWWRS